MTRCPACGEPPDGSARDPVFVADSVPAQLSRLYASADEALRAPRGRVEIVVCSRCGFAWNRAFDPELVVYDADYVDSQIGSGVFRRFVDAMIDEAVTRHGRPPRAVLEIGSGSGDVLRRSCARLGVPGTGFDPVPARPEDGTAVPVPVAFERRLFGPDVDPGPADLVVCRHTLEHLADPAGLLSDITTVFAGRRATVYLEVPDADAMLAARAFWDVYHEHVGYFGRRSLIRLIERCGLGPLEVRSDYGGQYLVAFARSGDAGPEPATGRDPVTLDGARVRARWAALDEARWTWARRWEGVPGVVVWGATSRTTQLLAIVPGFEPVGVCDINPDKWGRHLAGCAAPISSPRQVAGLDPDLVLAANPRYVGEIAAELERHGASVPVVGLAVDGEAGKPVQRPEVRR
ncbi:MAG: methyltransferase domain-containing protein [Deltaproteobacteria bacterium]|nr:MAG: methyltransferase domain-containing protein [Deltaproteobacteria bacterium]